MVKKTESVRNTYLQDFQSIRRHERVAVKPVIIPVIDYFDFNPSAQVAISWEGFQLRTEKKKASMYQIKIKETERAIYLKLVHSFLDLDSTMDIRDDFKERELWNEKMKITNDELFKLLMDKSKDKLYEQTKLAKGVRGYDFEVYEPSGLGRIH